VTVLDPDRNPNAGPPSHAAPGLRSRLAQPGSVEVLVLLVVAAALAQGWLLDRFAAARAQTLLTVFVSILVAALPFLVLGTAVAAAVSAFVPPTLLDRALPAHAAAAVPVAGLAGVVLPAPGVPAAATMLRRGVAPAAALAYMLATPALNPVVLIATAVAFPGRPELVAARFLASLAAAVVVGLLWLWLGRPGWLATKRVRPVRGWAGFVATVRLELVQAGGLLVIGAFAAGVLNAVVPPAWLSAIGGNVWFSVVALALLSVLLSVRAEAGVFVAASLVQFSLTARLAFLVVGPVADLRLLARQMAGFSPSFAVRFLPASFVVAVLAAVVVGWAVL
jgi:uncharacterized membrane protein YraQ (UPF0718 family)